MHVLGHWEDAREPRENPHGPGGIVQTEGRLGLNLLPRGAVLVTSSHSANTTLLLAQTAICQHLYANCCHMSLHGLALGLTLSNALRSSALLINCTVVFGYVHDVHVH